MTARTSVPNKVMDTMRRLTSVSAAGVIGAIAMAMMSVGSADAGVLLSQPWDGSNNLIASYDDRYAGFNFNPSGIGAIAYVKFVVPTTPYPDLTQIDEVSFYGGYLTPPPTVSDEGFLISFYADNNGAPGAGINSIVYEDASLGETLVGTPGGVSVYSYDINNIGGGAFQFGPGVYWLAILRELDRPGQWGWATSAAAGNNAYQNVGGVAGPFNTVTGGVTSQLGTTLAVEILGSPVIPLPEPATWGLLLIGFAGVGALTRHARSRAAVSGGADEIAAIEAA